VPAVEARNDAVGLVGDRDGRLVEGRVGRVFERGGREALVVVDGAIADLDELDLGHARVRREVRVEDGFHGRLGFAAVKVI
jgi:hypothetical protein